MVRLKFLIFPIVSLLAGVLTVFSFAPYGIWAFQLISLGILVSIIVFSNKSVAAFFNGWCYGFASLGAGFYWLFISLHVYGGMNALLAGTGVALLAAFAGLMPALACLFTHWLMKRSQAGVYLSAILLFPACWSIFEWVRGWIVSGLPWLSVGYAFTDSPLAGYAPVSGVFGMGFVVALTAGALMCIILSIRKRLKLLALSSAVIFALSLSVGQTLRQIEWTTTTGSPIHVRLLQGNVAQETKFNPLQIISMLDMYAQMISKEPADLIVTPETAIPVYPQNLPEGYLQRLVNFSNGSKSSLAIGIPLADSPVSYTNSLIVVFPQESGIPPYRYNKHHLVPFGEYIPTGFRWFVNMMRIPLGEFTRGELIQKPFKINEQWVLPNICYEDIFGEEIAARLRNEYSSGQPMATMLLNISNIAWFGDTIALPQHLQISRMRSLETGRPMLRSTNTGTTALIDEHGDVIEQLPPYMYGELNLIVIGTRGTTPYILFGNMLMLAVAFSSIITTIVVAWIRRKKAKSMK